MDVVARECDFVTGRTLAHGGAGDSSVLTAYGVFQGMRASAEAVWGTPSLSGRTVGVAGVGKVGHHLVKHLVDDGAKVVVTDVDPAAVEAMVRQYAATAVADSDALVRAEIDVYAPCALGGALTDEVVDVLTAAIVCGAANNQLDHPGIEKALADRGILYAPDYCVNSGGVIQVADELKGFSFERAQQRAKGTFETTHSVFELARPTRSPPPRRPTGWRNGGSATWAVCGVSTCATADSRRGGLRLFVRPCAEARLSADRSRPRASRWDDVASVGGLLGVARPLVGVVRGLLGLAVTLTAVQLACQRPEVRVVSAVLQVAGDLRLLGLRSAAPL